MKINLSLPNIIRKSSYTIFHNRLSFEVVTCRQAARAKNINTENELKTLILSTSNGYVALHICGNRQANLRDIKTALNCKQASLASPKELADLGLIPGAICPIIEPIWDFNHFISKHVLSLKYVSTNDGTRDGYYTFNPRVLLLSNNYKLGIFSIRKNI